MAKGNKDESLLLEGRLQDGWAYGLVMSDGSMRRVADYAGPEGVWARIEQAKKDKKTVTFSGAREAAGGKLDGFAILPAEKIDGLCNWGPSVLGAGAIEARIVKLEEALAEAIERLDDFEVVAEEGEDDEEGDEAPAAPDSPFADQEKDEALPIGGEATAPVTTGGAESNEDEQEDEGGEDEVG